jgi:hypothetical protein
MRLPGFTASAQAVVVDKPPAGPEWIREIKDYGFRIIARRGASAVCLPAVTPTVVAAQKQARSYDECRQLAISRGWKPRQNASARYLRRKAAGLETHPTGFMARCLAGIQD